MVQPLSKWRCDACGEWVTAGDGYVIWNRRDGTDPSMRIIHQNKCDDDEYTHSNALSDFLGADGLAKLTAMLSYGLVHTESNGSSVPSSRLPSLDHWVDFVRRVQIPFYEKSRSYLASSRAAEDLSDANEVSPYIQSNLTEFAANAN